MRGVRQGDMLAPVIEKLLLPGTSCNLMLLRSPVYRDLGLCCTTCFTCLVVKVLYDYMCVTARQCHGEALLQPTATLQLLSRS